MRTVYDERRKLMVELMRGVGFNIPVMPQGGFYLFADASRWTDDSYSFALEFLEKPGVGEAPGVDFGYARKPLRPLQLPTPRAGGTHPSPGLIPLQRLLTRASR